jgi:hypothetical protein
MPHWFREMYRVATKGAEKGQSREREEQEKESKEE